MICNVIPKVVNPIVVVATILLVFIAPQVLVGIASAQSTEKVQMNDAELTASDGMPGDSLGQTVAVSDNVVVVGGNCLFFGNPDCNTQRQGVVYVYKKPSAGWSDMVQT